MYFFFISIESENLLKWFQKDDDEGWTLPESQFVTEMIKPSTETYQSTFCNQRKSLFWSVILAFWETRNENANFEQNYDNEIVTEEKRVEVVEEVRMEVDALMREELKNLKAVCYQSLISISNKSFLFRQLINQKIKRRKRRRRRRWN